MPDDLRAEYERRIVEVEARNAELSLLVAAQAEQIARSTQLLDENGVAGSVKRRRSRRDAVAGSEASGPQSRSGTFKRRAVPPVADRELTAGLPGTCTCCGDKLVFVETAQQWQTDLPVPDAVVTRFDVEISRCVGCERLSAWLWTATTDNLWKTLQRAQHDGTFTAKLKTYTAPTVP